MQTGSLTPEPYPIRRCPACGGIQVAPNGKVRSERPAESLSLAELQPAWRGFFKDQKPFFTYERCAACEQLFSPRYFSDAQLGQLYGQMEDNTAGLPEDIMQRTQAGYAKSIPRNLPAGAYLELGPDIGFFTRAALTGRAFTHHWLAEPNRAVHESLRAVLGDRPGTLLDDPSGLATIPDNSLALAVGIHVLDHLRNPAPLLTQLRAKLCPGGAMLLVTHDCDSLAARVFSSRWPAYCLQHPQLYSRRTLAAALARADFARIAVTKTKNYFPLNYLVQHGLFAAGLGRHELRALPAWPLGLKLGNIVALGYKEPTA